MHTEKKCPLCDYHATLMHDNFQGYKVGMFFKIYRCDNCNTSFTSPQGDTTRIYEDIYRNGEKVPGYDRYWHFFHHTKDQKDPLRFLADSDEDYWGVRESLKKLVTDKKKTKILEIGSGLGYLTYALRKEGYDVIGLDISKEAIDRANSHFGDYYTCADLYDFSKENPGSYDIVILTEVIEHIDFPMDFIRAIVELLTKKGTIIMTTPNKSIAPDDIIWDTESPPVHHWWFSENSIRQIADKLNLNAQFVDYKAFYKKKPAEYRYGRARRKWQRSAILDEEGNLVRFGSPKERGKLKSLYKSAIAAMPRLKSVFFKSKVLLGAKITVCSTRGTILCAVLKRA